MTWAELQSQGIRIVCTDRGPRSLEIVGPKDNPSLKAAVIGAILARMGLVNSHRNPEAKYGMCCMCGDTMTSNRAGMCELCCYVSERASHERATISK
jgi:hypothetical protein